MKRILAAAIITICAAITGTFAAFAEAPAFDKSPLAFVVEKDAAPGKKPARDNVRFVNESITEKIVFNVYAFNEKNSAWEAFGVGNLERIHDTDIVDSPVKIKNFKYFAVVPTDGKKYSYKATREHHDLYIYVYNAD